MVLEAPELTVTKEADSVSAPTVVTEPDLAPVLIVITEPASVPELTGTLVVMVVTLVDVQPGPLVVSVGFTVVEVLHCSVSLEIGQYVV